MEPAATSEIGSATAGCPLLLPGLPGCVVLGAFVSVAPIALFSDPCLVLLHLPTFIALLQPAVAFSSRARDGHRVSPIAIAAVVGGLVASVALMLLPLMLVPMSRQHGWIYGFTWIVVPIFGLVGSALAAVLAALVVGIAWLVRRWKARWLASPQRSGSASRF